MSMRWTGVQKIIALLVVTSYRRFPSAQHLAPRHGMVEMKRLKPLVQGSSILRDESLFDELFNLVNPEIQWNPSGTATWTFVGIKSPGSPLMLRDTFSRNCWYSQEPTGPYFGAHQPPVPKNQESIFVARFLGSLECLSRPFSGWVHFDRSCFLWDSRLNVNRFEPSQHLSNLW